MDNEKAKEIKKIAMSCAEKNKPYCRNCSKGNENDIMLTCRSLLKDMLALINELESENEKLARAGKQATEINKRVTEINEELSNAHEKIEKQLKDRITELESENERLLDELLMAY